VVNFRLTCHKDAYIFSLEGRAGTIKSEYSFPGMTMINVLAFINVNVPATTKLLQREIPSSYSSPVSK